MYLTEAGRAREAVAFLSPWLGRTDADLDLLNALGMALAARGLRERRFRSWVAPADDPTNTQMLVNIGTVFMAGGDLVHARQAFESALQIDPGLARAHNSLGVIAARQGHMARRSSAGSARWRSTPRTTRPSSTSAAAPATGPAEEARPYLEAYLRGAPAALEARDIARVRKLLE